MAGLTVLVCCVPCFVFLPWGLIPAAFIIIVYILCKGDDFYEAHPWAVALLGALTTGMGVAVAIGVISHAMSGSSDTWGGFWETLFWLIAGVPISFLCLVDGLLLFVRLRLAHRKVV